MGLRTMLRLARWLGPWTDESRRPEDVDRRDVDVPARRHGEDPLRMRVVVPASREPTGALFLVPGLHYAGPDDPRLDRFLAILAHAGVYVAAPFLPDFERLRVGPALVTDTDRAFGRFLSLSDRPAIRPGVFSISFGSMPALRLASSPERADQIGGVVVFGGYADFADAIRFCLVGSDGLPHDPLNRPVLYMNLLPFLPEPPSDPVAIVAAWDGFVRATWGRPEMKESSRYEPVARRLAAGLGPEDRALYLMGCGVLDGGVEIAETALQRAGDAFDYLDARPHLSGLRCPVVLVHGRDDDVIPFTHAQLLYEALPVHIRKRSYITGLYAHTGRAGLGSAMAAELAAMVGILRSITATATQK